LQLHGIQTDSLLGRILMAALTQCGSFGAPARLARPRRRVISLNAVAAFAAFIAAMPFGVCAKDAAPIDPRSLLTQYKCYICHADRETRAGPAYVDVAAHFHGKRDAISIIAGEIRRGLRRGGPWHMPPHPEVSPVEARAMARYIMSLSK
jgi:cytochrome c551/c552